MTPPRPVIAEIGHLALRVTDLDAALAEATDLIGLSVSHRDGDVVDLTHGAPHHSMQLIGAAENAVDHVAFEADGPAALDEIRDRVRREGLEVVSDQPLDDAIADGFAFVCHDDVVYEVYVGMRHDQPPARRPGVGPTRFGHVTFNVPDPEASTDVLRRVLDFRVTDVVDGVGMFLRCNADHHAVGMLSGRGTVHHHAWEVQSIADLGRLGDLLDEQDRHLVWGPVRHGAGRNVAAYFPQVCGTVVEMYTDMERIYDEAAFTPRTWSTSDHRWYSLWGPLRPPADEFRRFGVPPFARARE
jgi:catechol-2,3-dioxygenase